MERNKAAFGHPPCLAFSFLSSSNTPSSSAVRAASSTVHHDGKLLNLTPLRAKTKVKTVLLREMLFADDTAFVSHPESGQQAIIDRLPARTLALPSSTKHSTLWTPSSTLAQQSPPIFPWIVTSMLCMRIQHPVVWERDMHGLHARDKKID